MLADDGQTYCFEVNPSPGFSWYEDATSQPIARTLARWHAGSPVATGQKPRPPPITYSRGQPAQSALRVPADEPLAVPNARS